MYFQLRRITVDHVRAAHFLTLFWVLASVALYYVGQNTLAARFDPSLANGPHLISLTLLLVYGASMPMAGLAIIWKIRQGQSAGLLFRTGLAYQLGALLIVVLSWLPGGIVLVVLWASHLVVLPYLARRPSPPAPDTTRGRWLWMIYVALALGGCFLFAHGAHTYALGSVDSLEQQARLEYVKGRM